MTVCSYYVTYLFQSESTHPSESTLRLKPHSSLAKWLSIRLRTKWFWVRVPLQLQKTLLLVNLNKQKEKKMFKGFLKIYGNVKGL